jgi:ketosteroid isomerase-like protein
MEFEEPHVAAIRAYFDGVNSERFDDVAMLFAPDGELIAPGAGSCRGRRAIAGYFAAALRPYREHFDAPTRTIFAGDTVAVELHCTGQLENGAPLAFEALDVFDFDADGLIVRLSSWYDSHDVRARLRLARQGQEPL